MLPLRIEASVFAIVDFPVPGGPNRKIERPLLIAGPSCRMVRSGSTSAPSALRS